VWHQYVNTSLWPSGKNEIDLTGLYSALSQDPEVLLSSQIGSINWFVDPFQRRTVPMSSPVAKMLPSGENVADSPPWNVPISRFVDVSQTWVATSELIAISRPLGENVAECIGDFA